jgi:hypothetical protein
VYERNGCTFRIRQFHKVWYSRVKFAGLVLHSIYHMFDCCVAGAGTVQSTHYTAAFDVFVHAMRTVVKHYIYGLHN